jgi:predicted MFS family arabinose efflux permease
MTLLYALHYAIPLYATSSYLHKYFNSSLVSATYVIGSLLSLIASLSLARSIRKFHSYQFTFAVALGEIVIVTLFGHTENPYLLPIFFIVHYVLQILLYVCLNIFIESFSAHAKVGSIRGVFLAILNLGILISPMIGGFILKVSSFATLYTVAALTLIPYLFLLHKYLSHIKEPPYHAVNLLTAASRAFKNVNLRAALIGEFTVQSFYSTMVIYSPLYLTAIGVPLTSYLGIILPIALLPLVLLPYELGYLADKKYGEKEMLVIGLLVLAVTVFVCVILQTSDIRIWAIVFLISRIGASLVETMSFSYYFKKVDHTDPSLTALFINMYAFATLAVGTVGIIIAPFLGQRPQLMFVILGCGILWSISYALPMKDTR